MNYDKAAVAKSGMALPKTLQDLTLARLQELVGHTQPGHQQHRLRLHAGHHFRHGRRAAFAWWAQMRANGLKVVKGWSEAYYTDFARNKGAYPLVVSYATSPAAEVFYSKEKITRVAHGQPEPQGWRVPPGGRCGPGQRRRPARRRPLKFVDFMRSAPVQEALQTSDVDVPGAAQNARCAEVMRHAAEPDRV